MSIVVVTVSGVAKLVFAGALNKRTKGAVDLILVQKPEKITSFSKRILNAKKKIFDGSFVKDAWYVSLLYMLPRMRKTLAYFREGRNHAKINRGSLPRILEIDSINSDEVYEILKKISPDLLVVWGSNIIKQRILDTAKGVINLHLGYCPHYRGTLANQNAVMDGEFTKIGATVHYVDSDVDVGDIISTVRPDFSKHPSQIFRDLRDRAQKSYIEIASKIHSGVTVPRKRQSTYVGKNMRLKEWTPERRYKVAKKMRSWEKGNLVLGEDGTILSA
jgi:folate-dependent phosphoribosylglycinamide formyltransferase PurN